MPQTQAAPPTLTLYYDGQCPLCVAEIEYLQSRNGHGQLAFVDVTHSGFAAEGHRISCDAALAQIHGRTAEGHVLVGVPVFAMAYKAVQLDFLAWVLTRHWLMPVLQPVYICSLQNTVNPSLSVLGRLFYGCQGVFYADF